jgi:NADH-quinone oxidoreductase subunit L
MTQLAAILLAPLLAAVLIAARVFRGRMPSALFAIGCCGASLIGSLNLLLQLNSDTPPVEPTPLTWLRLPNGASFDFGFSVDSPTVLMLVVVTSISCLVFLFSLGYMEHDKNIERYYALLSFFVFSMLGIVVATNLIQLFFFWELVGLSSYGLIGFWFERPVAAAAARKALLTNRLADVALMCGLLLIWASAETLDLSELAQRWPVVAHTAQTERGLQGELMIPIAALCIFLGAAGKSAQLPLHVWLPDAMEGPTPVSALIHAATMVAAGVYLLFRTSFLFEQSGIAADIVAWIGALTALTASLIAVAQRDLKRVLAYSTMSQLGYMVLAVGAGARNAGLFHLTTHAFFKALLFLGSASVLHALHHERDAFKMGGLWKRLPVTAATFAVGGIALSGVWPTSGYFSKDLILLSLVHDAPGPFVIALITALLTPFYVGRIFCLVFLGEPRDPHHHHPHESPRVMTIPLVLLGLAAVSAGWGHVVLDLVAPGSTAAHPEVSWGALLPLIPVPGLLLAFRLYARPNLTHDPLAKSLGGIFRALENRLYIDELYERTVLALQYQISLLVDWVERNVFAGLVPKSVDGGFSVASRFLVFCQNAPTAAYVFAFGSGAALLFAILAL